MATGDLITANSSVWIIISNVNDVGTVYFTGTNVFVYIPSTTWGNDYKLYRNIGTNASPIWSETDTYSGNGGIFFSRALTPGQNPAWKFSRLQSGVFNGNPTIQISVKEWQGTKNYPVYYYTPSTGVSGSYVNSNYRTNSGRLITWERRREMTH